MLHGYDVKRDLTIHTRLIVIACFTLMVGIVLLPERSNAQELSPAIGNLSWKKDAHDAYKAINTAKIRSTDLFHQNVFDLFAMAAAFRDRSPREVQFDLNKHLGPSQAAPEDPWALRDATASFRERFAARVQALREEGADFALKFDAPIALTGFDIDNNTFHVSMPRSTEAQPYLEQEPFALRPGGEMHIVWHIDNGELSFDSLNCPRPQTRIRPQFGGYLGGTNCSLLEIPSEKLARRIYDTVQRRPLYLRGVCGFILPVTRGRDKNFDGELACVVQNAWLAMDDVSLALWDRKKAKWIATRGYTDATSGTGSGKSSGESTTMDELLNQRDDSDLFSSAAIAPGGSENCLDHNKWAAFADCLTRAGALKDAIRAAKVLTHKKEFAYLSNFRELGAVDIATIVVRGDDTVVLDGFVLDRQHFEPTGSNALDVSDPASLAMQRSYPDATSATHYRIVGHRRLAGGGQRFIHSSPVRDGCEDCKVVAIATSHVDIRDGKREHITPAVWAPSRSDAPDDVRARLFKGDVREVQFQLLRRGYDITSVDGEYDAETKSALRSFRRDQCIDGEPEWDQETAERLAPKPDVSDDNFTSPCAHETEAPVSASEPSSTPDPAVTEPTAQTGAPTLSYRIGREKMIISIEPASPTQGAERTFRLGYDEAPPEALKTLEQRDATQGRVELLPGVTSWQATQGLNKISLLTGEIPLAADGILAPGAYEIRKDDTRVSLLARMRDRQIAILLELWETRAEGLPYKDAGEALILASIVEAETGLDKERPAVASVFINRLKQDMRLQIDSTVIYGITKGQSALNRGLRRSELRDDTPYNTYVISGLPPTPITNPGRKSIEAVMNPDDTNYLFYVADGRGGHAFAGTLAQHNKNVARWRKIEGAREKPANDSRPLTQEQMTAAFVQQVQPCWRVDPDDPMSDVKVTLRLTIGADGKVDKDSISLIRFDGNAIGVGTAFEAARRAIVQCQSAKGYKITWHDPIELTFNPTGDTGLSAQ